MNLSIPFPDDSCASRKRPHRSSEDEYEDIDADGECLWLLQLVSMVTITCSVDLDSMSCSVPSTSGFISGTSTVDAVDCKNTFLGLS